MLTKVLRSLILMCNSESDSTAQVLWAMGTVVYGNGAKCTQFYNELLDANGLLTRFLPVTNPNLETRRVSTVSPCPLPSLFPPLPPSSPPHPLFLSLSTILRKHYDVHLAGLPVHTLVRSCSPGGRAGGIALTLLRYHCGDGGRADRRVPVV